MIPLAALPCEIKGSRLMPKLLNRGHLSTVASLISLYETMVGQRVSEETVSEYVEAVVPDFRLAKALQYAMTYFYEIAPESPFDMLGRRLREDKWRYLRMFYEWVAQRYGFLPQSRRLKAIEEFCREKRLSRDLFLQLLESENPYNTVMRRKVRSPPSPETVAGIFNFLIIEKLLSISDRVVLSLRSRSLGTLAKELLMRAKRHEVLLSMKRVGSVLICDITGPYQLFKLPAVSEYGRHIAWILSPIVCSAERWKLRMYVVYRKRRLLCELSREDVEFLLPYWLIFRDETPRETYDSALEERVHSVLTTLLSRRGLRVLREPDVVILRDGTIVIPDFVVTDGRRSVYLEIVGYWRREYVRKKREKLEKLARSGYPTIALVSERARSEFLNAPFPCVFFDREVPFGSLCQEIVRIIHPG